jgi:hypothetical protein
MATQLKNIVRFLAVPAGGVASLPHGLAWSPPGGVERPQIPDVLWPSAAGWTVTADATNVSVINNQAVQADVDVLAELWHTFERAFGPQATEVLVPRPFVLNQGGGGGIGSDITYLPEAWEQMDVAANQAAVVVPASVSQLFDEMVMNRTVSILGIRTQLSEAITAGNLTVVVFINGVATAALLAHSAGVNPSGGGATFAPGIAVALAGQTVGVRVTTDAGFLPITTDLSVRLEVGAA